MEASTNDVGSHPCLNIHVDLHAQQEGGKDSLIHNYQRLALDTPCGALRLQSSRPPLAIFG